MLEGLNQRFVSRLFPITTDGAKRRPLLGSYQLARWVSTDKRPCGKLRVNEYSASGRTKKAGILVSGLSDH